MTHFLKIKAHMTHTLPKFKITKHSKHFSESFQNYFATLCNEPLSLLSWRAQRTPSYIMSRHNTLPPPKWMEIIFFLHWSGWTQHSPRHNIGGQKLPIMVGFPPSKWTIILHFSSTEVDVHNTLPSIISGE